MRLALGFAALTLALSTPVAGQQWAVLPGEAIGPVRLGMAKAEILSVLGRPASQPAEGLWTYETPFRVRIEFQRDRTRAITTWDSRAGTPDGLRLGSSRAAVIRTLGGSPAVLPDQSGVWLYNGAIGLAVFVRGNVAAAFLVMPPQAANEARPSPRELPPPLGPTPTQTPEPQRQTAQAGPAVVIENLSHSVGSTVDVTGILRNVGPYSRLGIYLSVSAETFKGDQHPGLRALVARHLEPRERERFTLDLGKNLWKAYTIRVDSYSPMQSGEERASASGSIDRSEYMPWLGENLRHFANASAMPCSPIQMPPGFWSCRITVTASAHAPSYARVTAVVVRVSLNRWRRVVGSPTEWREFTLVFGPGNWSSQQITLSDVVNFSASATASVVQVLWTLNF